MHNRILLIGALSALLAVPCGASTTKLLTPVPLPVPALAAPADLDHFTFVVGGDNRSAGHGVPMPPSLDQICREIGWIHPQFTLWTGDEIEGYGDTPAEANAEYDVFLKAATLTGVPMFNAPGNHEFSLDPDLLPVYQKRMGALYGSFDYGHSHFVSLNTSPVHADGTIGSATLDETEWTWLEEDLKANQGAANIFVMLHHYVFGPPDVATPTVDTGWESIEDRDRFHRLMVKYHVRAVFCGHSHIFWHALKDGVDYYISGGAGAPLDATPDRGGYLHYLLIAVDGAKISTEILQPWHLDVTVLEGDGVGPDTASARVTNTNDVDVPAGNICVHVPTPPAGQVLTVTANAAYKKKAKSVPAKIVMVAPTPTGGEDVVIALTVPAQRSVEVTVGPSSQVGEKLGD